MSILIRLSRIVAAVGTLSLMVLVVGSAQAGWVKDGLPTYTPTFDPPTESNGGHVNYNGLSATNLSTTFTLSAYAGTYTGQTTNPYSMGQGSGLNARVQKDQKYVYNNSGEFIFFNGIEAGYSCDASAATIGAANAGGSANTAYLSANGWIDVMGGGASAGYSKTYDHKEDSNYTHELVVSNFFSGTLPNATQSSDNVWHMSLSIASWANAFGNRRVPPPSSGASTTYSTTSHVTVSSTI